jgi:hypothetical protein
MNTTHSHDLRNVHIHFEAYGENDPEFKADLIMLMIGNVQELRDAAQQAYEKRNGKLFTVAVHKTKSTINLLDDQDLQGNIESMKEVLNTSVFTETTVEKVEAFRIFGDILIKSLEHQAALLRGGR